MLKEQVLSVFIFLRIPKEFNVTPPTIGKTCICPIVGDDTLYLFSILLFFFIDIFSLQSYNNYRDRNSVIENIVRPPLAAYK